MDFFQTSHYLNIALSEFPLSEDLVYNFDTFGPDVMSIQTRQQFHLTTVDFWPKTLLFRTQQVRNSMIQLILFDMLFSKENKDDFSREMFVLFLLDVNKFDIFQYFYCYSWWFAETREYFYSVIFEISDKQMQFAELKKNP